MVLGIYGYALWVWWFALPYIPSNHSMTIIMLLYVAKAYTEKRACMQLALFSESSDLIRIELF